MATDNKKSQVGIVVTGLVKVGKVRGKDVSSEEAAKIAKRALAVMRKSLHSAYASNAALLNQAKKVTDAVGEVQSKNLAAQKLKKGAGLGHELVDKLSRRMDKLYIKIHSELHEQRKGLEKGLEAGAPARTTPKRR